MRFDDRAMALIDYMSAMAEKEGRYVDQRSITRGEFSRRFDVSRTHATRLIQRMIDEGMLVEDAYYGGNRRYYDYYLSESVCDALFQRCQISWRDV